MTRLFRETRGAKYDCFLHHERDVQDAIARGLPVVTLAYQDFCAPCNSTKHYVEELATRHGFHLIRVYGALSWDPERAGEEVPRLQVWHGEQASYPLLGAQTCARIVDFLVENKVIVL